MALLGRLVGGPALGQQLAELGDVTEATAPRLVVESEPEGHLGLGQQ